jgi:hypothetical protein
MSLYSDINQDRDFQRIKARSEAYRSYLKAVAAYLPEPTRKFALSDWYYSDLDKCPHDSWVESLEIVERGSGERKEKRDTDINLRLLAASHRGQIIFHYSTVSNYALSLEWGRNHGRASHEDWLHDQITLAGSGEVEHEIVFSSGAVWKIRCNTISYGYQAISDRTPQQ